MSRFPPVNKMAARRRAAEDKNTKLLRELASLPANKQCFDCLQRGPTYINVTIGSFVCTTCSGILRGLTPPHRVKSISMTTFSPDEIEHLKSRGNEYCKYVWLGTYDTSTSSLESEVSDDQRKRDFMIQKYEKKRWYVDPDIAVKRMQNDLAQQPKQQGGYTHSSASRNNLPETQPLTRLLGKSPTPLVLQTIRPTETWPHPVSSASAHAISTKTTTQNQGSRSIDLLSELTSSSANSTFKAQASSASTANGNFANFESAFNSAEKTGWTSFDDDIDPLSNAVSRSLTLEKDSFSRAASSTFSSTMPRPLSLPTFAPSNPFKPLPNSGSSTTPSQWSSFAAGSSAAPPGNFPMSASLDAYPPPPSRQSQNEPVKPAFSPPTAAVSKATTATSTVTTNSNADRYAALADLDSLFNQPSASKAPSWTLDAVSSSSVFDVPVSKDQTPVYSTAPSNPFASSDVWNQSQASKAQTAFSSANPFQVVSEAPQVYPQPIASQGFVPFFTPMVGNSPSEENMRNQFNANYPGQAVTSPTNGFSPSQMMMQNGGFQSPIPSTMTWGVPASVPQWSSSHLSQGGLFTNDNKSNETAQHADWIQNPVNPFMVLQSNNLGFPVAPRSNSSNPFL